MFKKVFSLFTAVCCSLSIFSGSLSVDAADKTRVSVHDPSIFKDKSGIYYVFGSHIDAAKSSDLQNWTSFTNGYTKIGNAIFDNLSSNLAGAFAWAGEDLEDCEGGFAVWAPNVFYNPAFINKDGTKGAYMMYFCTSSTYMRSVMAYAVSQKPEGPYIYVDNLIYSGFTPNDSYVTSATKNVNKKYTTTNVDELIAAGEVTYNNDWFRNSEFNNTLFPNVIDPNIYYGLDGKMYMCYGSWSGGIFTLEIDPTTGKCIHPKSGQTADGRMIDSYFGTKIAGGYTKSGEGPFIEYNSETGYYYLWLTYGWLASTGGYNMRVLRSKTPDGPFLDPAGKNGVLASNTNLDSIGLKLMGNYKFSTLNTAYMAGGHNSVLKDDDGKWYIIYHTRFNTGNENHEVRVHSMYFNEDGWPVVTPFEYSGDTIAEYGYAETDIVGTYEYINHGNDTSKNINNSTMITLNSNGTISGSVTGTWEQAFDSPTALITIENQKYKGYFIAAKDETGKKVMSFTATGTNNQTIWGAKNIEYTGTPRSAFIDYTNKNSKLFYNENAKSDHGKAINLSGTNLLSDVSYFITNKYSGKLINLTDGNTADGTNIQQWTKSNGSQNEWRMISVDNDYFKIVSLVDEQKCLTVSENSAQDGLNVELRTYNALDNQLWKLIRNANSYAIVSKCSNDTGCLDVFEWSTLDGGNVNQWNCWGASCQLWFIDAVHPEVSTDTYKIKNINSGLFVSENNGNIVQGSSQSWNITRLSDGKYTIQTSDGRAITVENGTSEDGTNISLKPYTADNSQKFILQANKDGSYSFLTSVSNGLSCLDVFELSTQMDANIIQWSYWGGSGQKFVLLPSEKITSEPIIKKGDINGDNKVDNMDLIFLCQFLIKDISFDELQVKASDLTGDGMIDVADCAILKQHIMGDSVLSR